MKDIESKVAELMARHNHCMTLYREAVTKPTAAQMKEAMTAVEQECAGFKLALRTALESASRLPDGWVAVPVEPTLKMVEAGKIKYETKETVRKTYRAMISARPEVPHDH